MKIPKIITWIGLGAMTFGLMNGFINGDFFKDGQELLANPWGVMSMIDLYVGFTLFSMWIFYREKNIGKSVVWTILMMVLGFFTACIYLLIALYTSKGNWDTFYKGNHV
jgi:O-antigen/teichoic acid export membrane protein